MIQRQIRALKLELQFNRYIIITRYNTKYIKRSKPVHGNHYFNNIILYNIQIQYWIIPICHTYKNYKHT